MSRPERHVESTFLRREPFLVGAVLALAVALRLPDLFGWWPNPDEGIYYGIVTREGLGAAWADAMSTSHPPLYFLLLRVVSWFSTDFVALRSVAFLSACGAVYVFILVGREVAGEGTRGRISGLVAGLLLAVSPRAIVLSQVIRPYMLLLLLLSASLLFLLRYLRNPSTRLLLAHGTCSLLAVLLHYASVFGLGVIGVLAIVDALRSGFGRPEWRRLLAIQAVPALALATLYFSHLRGVATGPVGHHALEGWLAPYMTRSPLDAWFGFVGFHSMLVGEAWASAAALFTLGAAAYAVRTNPSAPVAVMAASGLALAAAAAALQLYPFGPTRHTTWLLVFVIPLISYVVGALVTSGPTTLARAAPLVVTGLVGAWLLAPVLDPDARPREISEHVLQEAALDAMAEVLDPGSDPPVILMSTETYDQLTPLYPAERQTMDFSPDGQLRRFRWGDRDVIVLPGRDFMSRPEEVTRVNHLYTGARLAEAEFGVELPRSGKPVLVLSGGWRSQGMADLVELARRVGPLGTTTSVPGLIALFLDLDAFGEALEKPSP